ncbi:hypothetical protein WJX77_005304 [Trebouxia sp. C0004]
MLLAINKAHQAFEKVVLSGQHLRWVEALQTHYTMKAEEIRMETASQDRLDGSRMRPSSAIFALSGLAGRSMLAMFMPTKEDPGALVTPPKTSAAGPYTFEDNQEGDYVVDVAPERTKKSNEVVKAGKKTLEELQIEYIKLRKKKRAQDSRIQALQDLCSKLRLENDVFIVEASHTGRLSATVVQLEMEMKSLKASLSSESTKSLKKLLTATEENAAASVTALNRKAVAARELAESLRQELSLAAAQHAQQLSELQQQLTASLQKRQLAAQRAISKQMSQHEVAMVRGYWMHQEAAVKKDSKEALTAVESRHSAELALVRAELSVFKQGEADRVAAVKQQYDSKLRDACSQHAAVVTQLHRELAVVKGLPSTQLPGQTPSPVLTPDHGTAQREAQEPQISLSALELSACTSKALSTPDALIASITVSTDIAQSWSSSAGAAVTAAAQSPPPATVKAYPLLEKWLAAGTDQPTQAAPVPAKHIISAAQLRDAVPACDTILAIRSGSAASEHVAVQLHLQQQTLTSHSPASTSRSSSNKRQLQADSSLTGKASRSSSSGEQQLQTCAADPGHLTNSAQPEAVGLAPVSCPTAASALLTIAAQTPASCYQPTPDQQPQQQIVTSSAANTGHITSTSSTCAESAQALAGLVNSPTPTQAHSARVADAVQTGSVKQTLPGWASGVKKAVSDQASMKKNTEPDQASSKFQPDWATANADDKESSSMVDSYTKSTLFSSPWDAAAAAAQLDASECDEVNYELLWTKGPQYWYDNGDDWGIDEE